MTKMLMAFTLFGCNAPCKESFSRSSDGICRAEEPCAPGLARGTDLKCHAVDDVQSDAAFDTGQPEIIDEDTALPPEKDLGGGEASGPGQIRVIWNGLSEVPAHGVVVMATVGDDYEPSAALCVVVLQLEIDIDGYLTPYTPGDDPCSLSGEPMQFDEGPVTISMEVVAGEGATPVFCDERDLVVSGDVTVDFSGVQSCNP